MRRAPGTPAAQPDSESTHCTHARLPVLCCRTRSPPPHARRRCSVPHVRRGLAAARAAPGGGTVRQRDAAARPAERPRCSLPCGPLPGAAAARSVARRAERPALRLGRRPAAAGLCARPTAPGGAPRAARRGGAARAAPTLPPPQARAVMPKSMARTDDRFCAYAMRSRSSSVLEQTILPLAEVATTPPELRARARPRSAHASGAASRGACPTAPPRPRGASSAPRARGPQGAAACDT